MKRRRSFFVGFLTIFIMLAGISLAGPENSEYDQIIKNKKQLRTKRKQLKSKWLRRTGYLKPTFANVAYGSHRRNILDFWQAESSKPTPFVVFIHGGAFVSGSKKKLNPLTLKALLDVGISVAAINYRYAITDWLPAAHYDARRALQFLRSKAKKWNLDKTKAGAFGGSAGAQLCMYLAFHDEMADPGSSDPVERESSRLTCVVSNGGQTTMDVNLWEEWIPGYEAQGNFYKIFGVQTETEYKKVVAEVSAIDLVSKDDPPIFMTYKMAPGDPIPSNPEDQHGWELHHVNFGIKLKEKMDALGVEADLKYPGVQSVYNSTVHFFTVKLK